MRPLWVPVLLLLAAPASSWGFPQCDVLFGSPAELEQHLAIEAVRRSPVKYHGQARNVVVLARDVPGRLIPFALHQQGQDIVVVPPMFAQTMCRIALATFLKLENRKVEQYEAAATAAGNCLDQGTPTPQCLQNFAADLAEYYEPDFNELSEDVQQTALNISRSTLNQIVMHEYAHHFLDHFARIGAGRLERIDAEFEADLFCVLNGVQAGEPPSASYYFFAGVESIERHSTRTRTPDYESAYCRAGNVDNITGVFGVAPMVLLDAAYGGGFALRRNSPEVVRSVSAESLSGEPHTAADPCSRITGVALPDAFQELKVLYARIETDADALLGDREQWTTERALDLLEDLAQMSERFQYMNGVAAKGIALVLRKWGLEGRDISPLLAQLESRADLQKMGDELLSEDYGRILQAQGLAILQEQQDVAPATRLSRSRALLDQAVSYNPAQSEAWINLAFIAFKQGDCTSAADYAAWAGDTATEEEHRRFSHELATAMRGYAQDPEVCRAQGQRFHPYPGL